MDSKIRLKKSIYIGIGGTGVQGLLNVQKCFYDSYDEIPPMIGFLAIDTDSAAQNKEITSSGGKKIKFTKKQLLVCTVKNALGIYTANPKDYAWVPQKNSRGLQNISGCGAGQIRSNGRFIAYYNYEKIKTAINDVIRDVNKPLSQESKYSVATNDEGVEIALTINVIASVAGGSGSGMLIDVLALINDCMNDLSISFNLYPWIVLPEVFKAMNAGPSMANVLYNTYGALRSLDYIQHLNPNSPILDLGYMKIGKPLFSYAYIINNYSQAGFSFNRVEDLLEVIAKCAFLPANQMGDELSTPFDNITNQKDSGTYDILDKKAWCASSGSSELIYDTQAVVRAYCFQIMANYCDHLLKSVNDVLAKVEAFIDDADIRENKGKDDVIDSLLSEMPSYALTIDDDTSVNDIERYLNDTSSEIKLEPEINEALNRKISMAERLLDKEYNKIINTVNFGNITCTIDFLVSLKSSIDGFICMMNEEKDEYEKELNNFHNDWGKELEIVKKSRGILSFFSSKNKEEDMDALADKVKYESKTKRNIIRREWAVKFYNRFNSRVEEYLQQTLVMRNVVSKLKKICLSQLQNEKVRSENSSKFKIYLHKDDVFAALGFIDEESNNEMIQMMNKEGIATLKGNSEEALCLRFFNMASGTRIVKEKGNITIDSVLREMDSSVVKSFLTQLKELSAPLWTYNTQGYNSQDLNIDRFVVIGVPDRDNSILRSEEYDEFFDSHGNKATFASTMQRDRIFVLTVEDLLPVYAINNFTTYESDYNKKINASYQMDCHIDQMLFNRMESEGFNLLPKTEKDNILYLWVMGILFDHIKYDKDTDKYWIASRKKGDPIKNYRLDLSKDRNVAYDYFKSESLYQEVEESLNKTISRYGQNNVYEKIAKIKIPEDYLDICQLRPLERANLYEQKFAPVKTLVSREIELISNLNNETIR